MIHCNHKGSGLVEVIVGASILSVISLTFFGTLSILSRFHERDMLSIKGGLLAEEGLEAIRYIKGSGWSHLSTLTPGNVYYTTLSASSWGVTTTPEVIDGLFYRTFTIEQVQRNASDDIVASGGTLDPNILLSNVSVAWSNRGATTTITYKTYVTNI